MSKFLRHGPCEACGSKDNVAVYEADDGRINGTCMGCEKYYHHYGVEAEEYIPMDDVDFDGLYEDLPFGTQKKRNISEYVAAFYGVRKDGNLREIYYPYFAGDSVSWKIRKDPKDFRVQGGLKGVGLFGQQKFEGGRKLIITEGEEDVLAIAEAHYQHYGKIYPIVGIPSSSNMNGLTDNIKWVQSFDEVILWGDRDEAGEKAVKKMAKIIGYSKVKVVSSVANDASDLAQEGKFKDVLMAVWNAKQYNPQGILTSKELWKELQADEHIVSVPYPDIFRGLNQKTKGMRAGEITLFTSGTGAGKSSMTREIMMHILETTEDKVGIISLEESPAETVRKLCMMDLKMNPGEHELPLEELEAPFQRVFGDDRVVVLDHQGAITESITDQLNYMASIGCKYLFVDHITILVSEGADGLTGNEATDKVMNDLLKVAKTHKVWIGLVSHLRKSDKIGKSFEQGNMPSLDDIRGSGSIKQVSMDIIAFARNSEEGENEVKLKVLKCRKTGKSGPAGSLKYDDATGRMLMGDDMEELDGF